MKNFKWLNNSYINTNLHAICLRNTFDVKQNATANEVRAKMRM